MTLRQSMGIVLGANIGTTVSSQIIALNVSMYSPVFLFIGFAMMLFSKSDRINNVGKVILYFGILFFGLFTMENSVEPLKEHPEFMAWLRLADDPLKGSLIGAFVTLVIQSSSATVGMAIILLKKGFLTVSGGIAVMLGAELGTCSDTLLATIKGSRAALRTGVFHLLFNLICILIGLFLFQPFTEFVVFISANAPEHRILANAHMLFNFLGVLVFFPFIPMCERAMIKMLPDK
jgi:phosphate:Na+ symporter